MIAHSARFAFLPAQALTASTTSGLSSDAPISAWAATTTSPSGRRRGRRPAASSTMRTRGANAGGLRYTAALDPRGLLRLELAEATKAVASGDAQS